MWKLTWVFFVAIVTLMGRGKGTIQGRNRGYASAGGRNMKLVQPFAYIDSKGQVWEVPAGTETDGASIPGVFWLTHPPFTGKYRTAAVIHDYYCRSQSRSWQDTHNVFFEAMRTAGALFSTVEGRARLATPAPQRGPKL